MLEKIISISKLFLEIFLNLKNHALRSISGKNRDMESGIWDIVKTKRIHIRKRKHRVE